MRRRSRPAAIAAIIALLAGGVVAGTALAAYADDGLEFAPALEDATVPMTATFTFSGSATEAASVNVYVDGEIGLCTATVAAGAWSCTTTGPLDVGTHTYQAIQTLSFEPFTQVQDEITLTVLLPVPTVSAPTVVPAAGTASFVGGNGYAGATIVVAVTDPAGTFLSCSTGILPSSGAWGCDIPFDAELPPNSTVTVSATQSLTGNADQATTFQFDVAAEPPASVTIDTPTDGFAYTWDPGTFATIDGRAPVGNSVSILIDGSPIDACTGLRVDSFGQWDCGSLNLSPGAHTIAAEQIVGETLVTDTAVVDVEVPAPDVAGLPLFAEQNDDFYIVGGSYGLEGYIVEVRLDGEAGCDTWVYAGTWSCGLDLSGFALGEHTLTVRQVPANPDAIVTSQTANHTLTIQPPGSAPILNCAFTPDGGFTASSPQPLETLTIYQLFDASGSSKGGGLLGLQGYCDGSAGTSFPENAEFNYDFIASCGEVCDPATVSVASLPPGDYEVYHRISDGAQLAGVSYESHSYVFTIPEAPTIATAASTTNSVFLSGAATPGDAIRIVRDTGTTLCTTTATGEGAWACAFPKSSASTARAIAVDPASGGMSAYSSSRNIPIFIAPPTPPTTPTTPTPAAPAAGPELPTLVTWFLEFGGDLSNLKPGDTFTLNVSGMPEGTEIEVWMHSTPRLLGTATGTGAPMQMELTVPDDIESGPHEIEMVAITPLGTNYFFTNDATVIGGVDPAEGAGEEPTDGEGVTGQGGAGSADRGDAAAPSALTGSLAPVAQIVANPVTIAIAGGLALALLLLVALPTELLNSSLSSNTSRLGRVYGAIDRAMTRAQDWLIRFTRSRAVAAGVLVVVVSIIYGFIDPKFGFDIVSLRLVLSLGIAFFLLSFVASWISGVIIRRAWGAIGVVALQPTIILFAVIGVIVARILDFSPGFLVGIAIGLELIQASKNVSARAVFVQLGVVTGLALAAWVVYSVFTPGNDFVGMLVEDTMVALTAEGLTGALIAVFPLKFLDGRELWEVSKRLWVAAFLLVSTAFALLVLPTAIEGTDVGDYGAWLIVFAVFGLTSLAVWLIFVRADRRATAAERQKIDA
jgi:hypothetical protein